MEFEINYKRKKFQFVNVWKSNNTPFKKKQKRVNEEITREIRKYSQVNKYQNLRDGAKAVLRGKFVTLTAYIRKEEDLNNLALQFKEV